MVESDRLGEVTERLNAAMARLCESLTDLDEAARLAAERAALLRVALCHEGGIVPPPPPGSPPLALALAGGCLLRTPDGQPAAAFIPGADAARAIAEDLRLYPGPGAGGRGE